MCSCGSASYIIRCVRLNAQNSELDAVETQKYPFWDPDHLDMNREFPYDKPLLARTSTNEPIAYIHIQKIRLQATSGVDTLQQIAGTARTAEGLPFPEAVSHRKYRRRLFCIDSVRRVNSP